jgi:eukaryotic-like serine/threonine-protein kinase
MRGVPVARMYFEVGPMSRGPERRSTAPLEVGAPGTPGRYGRDFEMGVEALEPNRVLAGRYKLELRLGAGGMGTIWRAEHLVLQAPVAVKLIDREAVPDDDTVARFLREAKAAAALRSPHVVQIIDYGVDGKIPFMVMELLEGENLAQRLKRVRRLSRQDTARILTHVGRAMMRAHEAGIVHRDLKPDNVYLIKNEDEEIAKVLDFGVAKVEEAALGVEGTRTRTGSILGTPYYMSPEQAQGNKAVDHRSDLWSLGVIAFECLTGKRPFYSDGLGDLVLTICVRDLPVPSDVAPVPLGFDRWFARACARDPEARFQNAREMMEALRESLGLEPREISMDTPEISVAADSRPEPTEALTVAREPGTASGARLSKSRPDTGAATVIANPGEAGSDAGVLARTEALFGTAQQDDQLPLPRKSRTTLVLVVAMSALAFGLVGGLMVLRQRQMDHQETMRLPEPAAPPVEESETRPKKPETGAANEAPEAAQKQPDVAASASASSAPVPKPPESPAVTREPEVDAGDAADEAAGPDGGWEKPDWARPDNEITIRRGPDQADEKIVLPADKTEQH